MDAINDTATSNAAKVSGLERSALRRVLAVLGNPPIELVLWNGEVINTGGNMPEARLRILNRGMRKRKFANADIY